MNRKFAIAISILLIVSLGVGMLLLLRSSREKYAIMDCNRLEVSFTDSLKFVSESDVRNFLDRNYGIYVGQRLDSVRLARIEEMLESRNVVLNSEAWVTADGTLHVRIDQRAPVMRFMDGERGFYMDAEGYIFPLHKTYTADVPVVEGRIPQADQVDEKWKAEMLGLHSFLQANRRYALMVEKMSIDGNGELVIQTGRGDERFVLGRVCDMKEKFEKIERYYAYIVPQAEKQYKKVILKYKNQIICREKDI